MTPALADEPERSARSAKSIGRLLSAMPVSYYGTALLLSAPPGAAERCCSRFCCC